MLTGNWNTGYSSCLYVHQSTGYLKGPNHVDQPKSAAAEKKKWVGRSRVWIQVSVKFSTVKSLFITSPTPFIAAYIVVMHVWDALYDCTLSFVSDMWPELKIHQSGRNKRVRFCIAWQNALILKCSPVRYLKTPIVHKFEFESFLHRVIRKDTCPQNHQIVYSTKCKFAK